MSEEEQNNNCQLPHPRLKAGKVSAKEITVLREIIEAIDKNGSSDVRGVVADLDNKNSVDAQMKKITQDAVEQAPQGLSAVAWSLTDAEKALDLHEDEDDQALFKTCISMLKTAKVVRQLGRGRGQALVLLTDGFIHVESPQHPPYEFCHGAEIPTAVVDDVDDDQVKIEEEEETPAPESEGDDQGDEFYPDGQPVPPTPGDEDVPPQLVEVAQADINSMQEQLEALVKVSSEQTKEYQALQALVREAIQQNAADPVVDEVQEEAEVNDVAAEIAEVVEEEEDEGDDSLLPSIHSF